MNERFQDAFQGLIDKLNGWFDTFVANIPNMILAAIVFFIAYRISKFVQRLILRSLTRVKLSDSLKKLISNIGSSLIIMMGLVLVLVVMNLEGALSGILMAAGVSGLVLGLALQSPLSNSFAGVILSVQEFINVGDFISSNGIDGQVVDISLRNTTIQTAENDIVYLPNRDLLDNPLLNNSTAKRNRMIINGSVAYHSDMDQVEQLTKEILGGHFDQASNEEVEFFFTNFADSGIEFTVRYWVDADSPQDEMGAVSKGMKLIKQTFEKNNIEIPYPVRHVLTQKIEAS